jgi:hypothetical protein
VVAVLTRQLLVYRFDPGVTFEGQLVGALERLESGGAVRVLDALFVMREPETGEVVAASLEGGSAGGVLSRLLDFRLDTGTRAASTERTLAGPNAEVVQRLAAKVEPGGAIAALLVEHAWAQALEEAVGRLGGAEVGGAFVESARLSDAAASL